MKCFYCGCLESRVMDSRATDEGNAIRRRRECMDCEKRFTTYEKVEETPLVVIKRDGSSQVFDRNKVINGLVNAIGKGKIPLGVFEGIADGLEKELRNSFYQEVTSDEIGHRVLDKLHDLDEVAYVRFASVYYKFKDIEDFKSALERMPEKKTVKEKANYAEEKTELSRREKDADRN